MVVYDINVKRNGESIPLRVRNTRPVTQADGKVNVREFVFETSENLDGAEITVQLRKRTGPNND
jgi:hypothetical protein